MASKHRVPMLVEWNVGIDKTATFGCSSKLGRSDVTSRKRKDQSHLLKEQFPDHFLLDVVSYGADGLFYLIFFFQIWDHFRGGG